MSYSLYYPTIAKFCIYTIILVHVLSSKLGFPVYVPSIFKFILAPIELIFGSSGGNRGGAKCSPQDKPKSYSSESFSVDKSKSYVSRAVSFFTGKSSKFDDSTSSSPTPFPNVSPSNVRYNVKAKTGFNKSANLDKEYFDACSFLKHNVRRDRRFGDIINKCSSVNGNKENTYIGVGFYPFFVEKFTACITRDVTRGEKKNFLIKLFALTV